MRSVEPLSAISIIRASYAFVPKAVLPGAMGTVMFVLLSLLGRYLRSTALFGAASGAVGVAILLCFSLLWFAMAFRAGLGLSRARYILALGKQELSLGVSLLGFAFVLGIVGFLIGFLVFLLVMMLAAIGGGALSGADVASASIFETPEAFRAFLSGTATGQIIGVLGLSVLISAVLFLFWLFVRLAPFAAAAVQEQRFVVLQAMSWTRYKDRPLMIAALATIGVALALIFLSRAVFAASGLPLLVFMVTVHGIACFCVLLIVGYICEVYRQLAIDG